MRQMVLTEIAAAMGSLPAALASAWVPVTAEQRQRTSDLLLTWSSDPLCRDGYAELARQVDVELRLEEVLPWSDGLYGCAATPAIEKVALAEAVRRFEDGELADAGALAELRLRMSPWVQPQGPSGDGWATTARQWRAVLATAQLLSLISQNFPPNAFSPGELLEWYVDRGWEVDRAHRRLEIARNDLRILGDLEPAFTSARVAHEDWLDATLLAFTNAVETARI